MKEPNVDRDESATPNTLDDHFSRFRRELKEILGEGRIPRAEKEAKATEAIRAVDDLVAAMDEEIWGDQQPHLSK